MGFSDEIIEYKPDSPPPRITDWKAPEGALTESFVKSLKIGARLLVHGKLEFCYFDGDERYGSPVRYEKPVLMSFVGYGYRNEGIYNKGCRGTFYDSEGEPPSFTTKRRIFVVKLKDHPRDSATECLPQQLVFL